MIVWTRWGIVVLAFIGLGIGLGFIIMSILGLVEDSGSRNGIFVGIGLMLSGGLLWLFNQFVVGKHIDKPQPAVVWEPLAEPAKDENGVLRTHRAVPIRHSTTGEQLWTNPTSTFFFIPIRIWAYIVPALGLLIFLINLVITLTRG